MTVLFVVGLMTGVEAIPRIIAPEWSTTVDIIHQVKELKSSGQSQQK